MKTKKMKTKEQVEKQITDLKENPCYSYETAVVFSNAPLALIQCELEAKVTALEWVLNEK